MARQSVIALLLFTLVVTGNALSHTQKQKVDALVQKVMQCANIPALGVALVGLDDGDQYIRAYGVEDVSSSSRETATIDTRFCLGGATEAFTAVMLAKLIHENENITWSTPIQDIIRHRVVMSETYRSLNLNLKDIFSQRSGYPNMDIVSVTRPYDSSDKLTRYLKFLQPVAGFREKFVPNQILFSLLDEVVATEGTDWETLIKELIFEPLEMNSALFLEGIGNSKVPNVALPVVNYRNGQHSLPLNSFKGLKLIKQASSLCLSPRDMFKWVRFLLRGKDHSGQQLMDMDVLEETFKGIQSRGADEDPAISGYRKPDNQITYAREQNALGFITGHYRGYQFVSQDGSIPGAQTLATILPDRNIGVFTSFTGGSGSEAFAAKTLINLIGLDTLMTSGGWFDLRDMCTTLNNMKEMHVDDSMDNHDDVRKREKLPDDRPLEDFVGNFKNYAYGKLVVRFNVTGDQRLTIDYGDATYKLYPTNQNNTFLLDAQGSLWFTTKATDAKRFVAVFVEDARDPVHRFRDLVISGFDKTGDVMFSVNAAPPHYGHFYRDCPDDNAASTMTSAMSLLVTSLYLSVAVFFR